MRMSIVFRWLVSTVHVFILFAATAAGQESFGLGLMVGEPTGFSGKVWHDDVMAFDGGLAWSFSDETDISVHGDVLWHNWRVLAEALDVTRDAQLPLYYGIGGRLKAGDDARFGVRFVLGASLMFDEAPFDVFFEMAPIMDIVPDTTLRAHAALGCRFWF